MRCISRNTAFELPKLKTASLADYRHHQTNFEKNTVVDEQTLKRWFGLLSLFKPKYPNHLNEPEGP